MVPRSLTPVAVASAGGCEPREIHVPVQLFAWVELIGSPPHQKAIALAPRGDVNYDSSYDEGPRGRFLMPLTPDKSGSRRNGVSKGLCHGL